MQPQVLRIHAEWLIRLHVDFLDATVGVQKVVDIARAPRNRERLIDVAQADAECARFLPIDVDLEGRVVLETVGPHECDGGVLASEREQLVTRLHEPLVAHTAAIFQLEVEARSRAELANRRGIDRDDDGVAVGGEARPDALHESLHPEVRAPPHVPVPEVDEQHSLILSPAGEVVTVDLKYGIDHAGFLVEQIVADLVEHGSRTALRGARRQLYLYEHIALILVRQERRGQVDEQHRDPCYDYPIDEEPPSGARDDMAHAAPVLGATRLEMTIEPAEEPFAFGLRVTGRP